MKQTEAMPVAFPVTDADTVDALWIRIEAYCSYRWTARSVEWIVEGCGAWNAPLAPADVTLVERWNGSAYETVTPDANPYGGYVFTTDGPYRVTATVGDSVTAEADVLEAYNRLYEYTDEAEFIDGANLSSSISIGDITETNRRAKGWAGNSLINSGAADLLRRYRKAV